MKQIQLMLLPKQMGYLKKALELMIAISEPPQVLERSYLPHLCNKKHIQLKSTMANGGKLLKFQKEINSKSRRNLLQMMKSGFYHPNKTATSILSIR